MTDQSGARFEAADAAGSGDGEEIAEIRSDIEETRLEMGDTLTELGDRLEPSRLVNQAKENVREATIGRVEETARGVSDMVMETIKRNPIPAALAGAGLAMLWANRSSGNGNGNGNGKGHDVGSGYGMQGYRGGQADGTGQKVGDVASGVGQNIGEAASSVGRNVGDTVGQVGETVGQVGGEVVQRGRQTVDEVGWRLDRFVQTSPLAVGAIAIGAGALVGALVPETRQEREVLGDASRQLGTTVRDTVSQATDKAEESFDEVERSMSGRGSSG